MASSQAPVTSGTAKEDTPTTPATPATSAISAADFQQQSEALYEECLKYPPDTLWAQRDLANLQIAETTSVLMRILQHLTDTFHLKMLQQDGIPCWKIRSKTEVQKLVAMTPEERRVYSVIDEAQAAGVWSRLIRNRTNMQQVHINRCLKTLEQKGLIQTLNNAKNPTRKMVLLADLVPSTDITGGPWYSDGEVDIALINVVEALVQQYVEKETWVRVPKEFNATMKKAEEAAIAKRKEEIRKAGGIPDMEDFTNIKFPRPHIKTQLVPIDPSLVKYPTIASIAKHIRDSGIVKVQFSDADMELLLQAMVNKGILEKMGPGSFRTDREMLEKGQPGYSGGWNGFADSPCGMCPVFSQCEEGSEINALTCEYWGPWLENNMGQHRY